ncbi:LrgB family protein [Vagococcus xieshaowenii]|uniref:LrgB family protein n=1 Tax=Vagococcus xieshaowenii TaxID=2562451 RepID=A0AAJ5EER2_9ENTE|nr:LrgB family protein [Vagococcus xieshaowenii]QCA29196.1 LrgB family protein [Vagococcus xieshaowenii]TFZ40826.1 LrgB family protein [Vagococcus xieshaowenii]
MIDYLSKEPIFGVMLTVMVFMFFRMMGNKYQLKWLNPLAFSIIAIILFLKGTNISYDNYFVGAKYVDMFIGPATVALALPLYRSLPLIKKHATAIMMAVGIGTLFNISLVLLLSVLFKLKEPLTLSLVPKSVTTAIAMDLSTQIGGVAAITVLSVITTGVLAPLCAEPILKLFGIHDPMAQGLALGTTSHAIGTSKAMEMGEVQGAMSGLAIGIAGIATVILAPLLTSVVEIFIY